MLLSKRVGTLYLKSVGRLTRKVGMSCHVRSADLVAKRFREIVFVGDWWSFDYSSISSSIR